MVIIIATSKRMTANVTIGYNNNPSKSYAFGMTMFCIINKPSSNTFAKPYTNNTPTYPRPNSPSYFLLPSPPCGGRAGDGGYSSLPPPLWGKGWGWGLFLSPSPLVGGGLGMGAILLSLPPCGGRAGDGGAINLHRVAGLGMGGSWGVVLSSLRASCWRTT